MSVEIIIKKLNNAFNSTSGALKFGDVRQQMATDLLKSLTTVIERKADHPRPYYILVHCSLDHSKRNTLKERIILLDELPSTKLIGTLAFKVDNKHGDAEMIWNLPMDIPGIWSPESGSKRRVKGAATIMESVTGLPIINRN